MPELKKPSEILRGAATRVHDLGWCQRAYAKDAGGIAVHPCDPRAICFCLIGAIVFEFNGASGKADPIAEKYVGALIPEGRSVRDWNDDLLRTADEVVGVLLAASAAAELAGD